MNYEDRTPDFVNEIGVKWWLDSLLTEYARKPNANDITLDDVTVFVIQYPDTGAMTRVITQDGKVIHDASSIEAIATRIDVMKIVKWGGVS